MQYQPRKNTFPTLMLSVVGLLFFQCVSPVVHAAVGDVLFSDDFERATLGANWTENNSGGGDAGIGTYTSSSGTRSLFTRWDAVSVTSTSIDLSAIAGAQLDMWVRRGSDAFSEDPEVAGSEDLVIEYRNNVGAWQQLVRYVAGDTPGEIFTPTFYLSSDALHAGFQLRIRQIGGDGNNWDYWHVDDVVVTETAGLPSLAFPFCDNFESGLTNWQVQATVGDAGIGSQTASSASNSLYLRWGDVSVASYDIDLSTQTAADLNFWLRRGADSFSEDPDNNEDFTVEYYNSSGVWTSLGTYNGNGTPGEIYTPSYTLPADALHSAFKVRFSMSGNDGSDFDYWHVDDVCVEGPPAPPSPVALYYLDESAWGAVTDSSGNGHDGSVVGGAVPDSTSPAVAGSPGTCGYADIPYNNSNTVYDAIDTGIDVDTDIGNVGSIDFWYKSNRRWNGNNGDRQLLDASTTASGQKYFFLTLQNNSRLRFGLEDSNDGDYTLEGGNNNFNAGVWVHLAVTWDLPNDRLQIYINGNLDDEQTFSTNGVLGNLNTLYIGDNRSTYQVGGMTGNSANGSFDEVRIYDAVLSQAEIQADMNSTHPCGILLDHFVVAHDGLGINCLPETITVTAAQADGSTYTGYTGSIVLDTQSGNGTWTLNTGTAANFSDAAAGDGLATYTFDAADNGVAVFNLDYPTGTASIDVDAYEGTIRDDDTEGNLVFSPSGFTVTQTALTNPPPAVIDTSINSQTAASDFSLYLAAYGQTPNDPTCGIIEAYSGNQSINFWSGYNNPATGTLPVAVNGNNVATSEAASSAQTVAFVNGQAVITVNYPDVGEISLSMKDDTTGNPDLPNGIAGSSDAFVVKPAGFVLSNIRRTSDAFPNPAAANETGSIFIAAGSPFSATVTAVNSLGAATPNYGQELVPESVLLTPTLIAAGGANNPAIGFSTGFDGQFINGVATGTDFSWSEVGIIALTPSVGDADYLGAGDVIGTTTGNVGRFIPFDFNVTLDTAPALSTQCGSFTYMGQSFVYATVPTVTITARSLSGATTVNYDNVWWKLADFTETYSHNGVISAGAALDASLGTHTAVSCVNCAGSVSLDFGGSFVYTAASQETDPFAGAMDISFAVTDSDGVSYGGNPFTVSAIGFDSGAEQRSGRGYARDVFTSDTSAGATLTMPVGTEYYAGAASGWLANGSDSCTTYSYTKVDSDTSTTVTAVSPVTIAAGSGDLSVQLDADSSGNATTVSFTWPAWLSGTASAVATFGVYRGDDRFIYWREAP